ncbi:hypothetical protein [Paenibacillus agilis]|uniref:Uncharacterized protein n=1 Tax=Paenibacillus agilis TaxID=3020863 RepID=A0A559IEI4_9BACL|nr:hypothetical protein [Paenibacillus agilis]TVX86055.1 hypothetical protein FPZ44_24240 [Paenibacillus agilis]
MNNFKLAHAIAKVLTGSYAARMAYAWEIIKGKRLNEVSELFDIETLTPKMYVSKYESIKPQSKQKKVLNKSLQTNAKKVQPIEEPAQKIVYNGLPSSIAEHFNAEQSATIQTFILRYIEESNKMEGAHMDKARFNYEDGIKALANVYDIQSLQAVMIAYFLRSYVQKTVKRFLDMGVNFKQLENVKAMQEVEARNSYMRASSNSGSVVAFDVDDITNELIVDAYRLTFNEQMFDSENHVIPTIFLRIKNVLKVQLRKLRNQTLVVTASKNYVQEEGATRSTEEEAVKVAEEMGIFSDAEMNIIKLRLAGFKKTEIDKQIGKRTDRDFKRIEKAYNAAV